MTDYLTERHPDNVGAALYGGFVGTYLQPLSPEDLAVVEIPLAEVLPAPAGGLDTGKRPPEPPNGIGRHIEFSWAKEIKAVAIIPEFQVPTAKAREVLPKAYPRQDVVRSSSLDLGNTSQLAPAMLVSVRHPKWSRQSISGASRFIH
jgi:homoserine kinase